MPIIPIERLIDDSMICTQCGAKMGTCHCWDDPEPMGLRQQQFLQQVKALATEIAKDVIGHIDTHYPAMWLGVPKTARVSVRNTIINGIVNAFAPPVS